MKPQIGLMGVDVDAEGEEKVVTLVECSTLSQASPGETVWAGKWDDGECCIGVSVSDGTFTAVTLTPARARKIAVRLQAWADEHSRKAGR